jgi:hypothetical protein
LCGLCGDGEVAAVGAPVVSSEIQTIIAADLIASSRWQLSSSSDRRALDIVDGCGMHEGLGPHYSRRTPGSKTFTGVGREIVLVTRDGRAVWACIYQRTPSKPGTGASRGRRGETDDKPRYLWRNMMFRNLGAGLSSDLIQEATEETYRQWIIRYGSLPPERLRTEIGVKEVRSRNPGYCYERAGWERGALKNGRRFYWAPQRDRLYSPAPTIFVGMLPNPHRGARK